MQIKSTDLTITISNLKPPLFAINHPWNVCITDRSKHWYLTHSSYRWISTMRKHYWKWGNMCIQMCVYLMKTWLNDLSGVLNIAIVFLSAYDYFIFYVLIATTRGRCRKHKCEWCYQPDGGEMGKEEYCCHPYCLGGCSGPTAADCFVSFLNNSTALAVTPPSFTW